MGFDMYVILNISVDPITGLPIVYELLESTFNVKKYNPSEYEIPEKYRKYIRQRGSHFHAYIKSYPSEQDQTTIEDFLHRYPEWPDWDKLIPPGDPGWELFGWRKNDLTIFNECKWTKEDHDAFKEALIWMDKKGIFGITWHY